jgi:hypothetical protein
MTTPPNGFAEAVRQWTVAANTATRTVFVNVASHALRSIQFGSDVTGAPGQPVDEGHLRASWQLTFPTPDEALIATASPYALANEEGVTADGRPYRLRSPVGGRHSVKLTIAGMPAIVAHEAAKVRDESP